MSQDFNESSFLLLCHGLTGNNNKLHCILVNLIPRKCNLDKQALIICKCRCSHMNLIPRICYLNKQASITYKYS